MSSLNSITPQCVSTMCVQAEAASLTVTDQLQSYVVARTPLLPLAQTGSLVFDLLHECLSHQTTIISSTQFLVYVAAALRGEEMDGEEANVLGSLATALQATAEMMSAAEGEREERERQENTWRTGILRELSVSVMKDATRSVLMQVILYITLCLLYLCTVISCLFIARCASHMYLYMSFSCVYMYMYVGLIGFHQCGTSYCSMMKNSRHSVCQCYIQCRFYLITTCTCTCKMFSLHASSTSTVC